MGSEQSHQRDVQVDKRSVETTDFWTLYDADQLHGDDGQTATSASMFRGEPVVAGQLWATTTPLDRASKNLMVYRHPSILKFLKSSVRGAQTFLLTERCRPLAADLATQSDVQICLGLRSVLCALVFLVERAGARHLNVSAPVIYVTPAGAWRLAGFEQVWKSAEVTVRLLEISQPFRSRSGIQADELKVTGLNLEQYAFGALCAEILHNQPAAVDFVQFCRTQLQNPVAAARPSLASVLQHEYFTHDFVTVHSFLTELPLKSGTERLHFFTHLTDRLRRFDERNVGAQLAELLLGRMVLSDPTAQLAVVPHLLSTRSAANPLALFAPAAFRRYVVPRIVQLFGVLETQTRLILLEYFRYYAGCVEESAMRQSVLPQLLLGIRDSDDVLVAATLRALAELVPMLGASTVIGRNRVQIFADGRPQGARGGGGGELATADLSAVAPDWMEHRSITPVLMTAKLHSSNDPQHQQQNQHQQQHIVDLSESGASTARSQVLMLERLSPDGGEDEKTASDVPDLENDAAWSDWEADDIAGDGDAVMELSDEAAELLVAGMTAAAPKADTPPEIDYFADMEPVIQKTSVLLLIDDEPAAKATAPATRSGRLSVQTTMTHVGDDGAASAAAEEEAAGGWGDDVDGWTDS